MGETAEGAGRGESARERAAASAGARGTAKAQRFVEALYRLEYKGDTDSIASLFADDAEVSNPTDDEPHRGREGARAFWSKYRQSFDHVHSAFRNIVEADDAALLEWSSEGRTAAGDDFAYDGVSVLEFERGEIRRFRAYFDPRALGPGAVKTDAVRAMTPTERAD